MSSKLPANRLKPPNTATKMARFGGLLIGAVPACGTVGSADEPTCASRCAKVHGKKTQPCTFMHFYAPPCTSVHQRATSAAPTPTSPHCAETKISKAAQSCTKLHISAQSCTIFGAKTRLRRPRCTNLHNNHCAALCRFTCLPPHPPFFNSVLCVLCVLCG